MKRANREPSLAEGPNRRRVRPGTGKAIALIALLSVAMLALPGSFAANGLPNTKNNKKVHHFVIKETDYKFTPNHMTWTVGEVVRITLKNESSNPATEHEFLIGKGVKYKKTKFGRGHPAGWKTPLISNDIKISWGAGKKVDHLQKGAPGHAALSSGGQITEQFTVPNKPGTWYYACFEQKGEHFLKGMKGTITIKPKNGSSAKSSNGSSSGNGSSNKSKSGIGNGSGPASNS